MTRDMEQKLVEIAIDYQLCGFPAGRKSLHSDSTLMAKIGDLKTAMNLLDEQRLQMTWGWDGVTLADVKETVQSCARAALLLGAYLADFYPHEHDEIAAHGAKYLATCWEVVEVL